VATVNGTADLHIALQLVGVKKDDLVITQSFSFIATANAIQYTGASPYFVDIEEESLGMNVQSLLIMESELEKRSDGVYHVSTNRRIGAVVPMHSFGMPCEIELIAQWCEQWGVPLVEDAAESLGSFYKGRHTGMWGKIGVMSFNGNKTITAGGGGVILTDDEELAKRAKHLTTQAKLPHPYEFIHDDVGYNYRCPNLNAALLCAQLEYLDDILADKRNLALEYARFFEEYTPHFRFVTEGNFKLSNYLFRN
jgi:dTDP-4-amino-4,6-dideoxygalactose transaminase